MRVERLARQRPERVPAAILRKRRRLAERFGPLLVHLEEQQETDLAEVIAERDAVIPQDMRIVPDLRDERLFVHWISSPRKAAARIDWRRVWGPSSISSMTSFRLLRSVIFWQSNSSMRAISSAGGK